MGLIDLVGQRFGRLIVLERVDNDQHRKTRLLCLCNCGTEVVVRSSSLKNGDTRSCGCLRKETLTKHGHTVGGILSKTYTIWMGMLQRCFNSKSRYYYCYGKRGITVCKRWKKFENFLKDMGETPIYLQLDRIKNDKNYCKSNCRWVTRKEQQRNKRTNHLISYNNKQQCLSAWAEETGICAGTLLKRIKLGWSTKRVLTTSVGGNKK